MTDAQVILLTILPMLGLVFVVIVGECVLRSSRRRPWR